MDQAYINKAKVCVTHCAFGYLCFALVGGGVERPETSALFLCYFNCCYCIRLWSPGRQVADYST